MVLAAQSCRPVRWLQSSISLTDSLVRRGFVTKFEFVAPALAVGEPAVAAAASPGDHKAASNPAPAAAAAAPIALPSNTQSPRFAFVVQADSLHALPSSSSSSATAAAAADQEQSLAVGNCLLVQFERGPPDAKTFKSTTRVSVFSKSDDDAAKCENCHCALHSNCRLPLQVAWSA